MDLTEALNLVQGYLFYSLIYWLMTAFIAGFSGNELNKSDFYGGLIWPVSIVMFLGQITRIFFEKIKEYNVKH